MNDIFSVLIAVLLLPYLVVPILIRRNQSFAVRPQIRPVVGGFLPATIESYFEKATEELKPLGFEHRIDAISLDYGPNLRVFLRLFVATKKSVLAIATSLLPDGEKIPLRNFIEFSSRFDEEKEVSTHNSELAGAPIEPAQKITTALPPATDALTLFVCHEQVLKRNKLDEVDAFVPKVGEELDLLIESFKKDLSYQCRLGSLTFDKANNCFRPTWAGAFLIGWYSMWPLSHIRRGFFRIKAKMSIRSLKKASV